MSHSFLLWVHWGTGYWDTPYSYAGMASRIHVTLKTGIKIGRWGLQELYPETVITEEEILLKRTSQNINNYNPLFMTCIRSNHDIKFIPSGKDGKACAFNTDNTNSNTIQTHSSTKCTTSTEHPATEYTTTVTPTIPTTTTTTATTTSTAHFCNL